MIAILGRIPRYLAGKHLGNC